MDGSPAEVPALSPNPSNCPAASSQNTPSPVAPPPVLPQGGGFPGFWTQGERGSFPAASSLPAAAVTDPSPSTPPATPQQPPSAAAWEPGAAAEEGALRGAAGSRCAAEASLDTTPELWVRPAGGSQQQPATGTRTQQGRQSSSDGEAGQGKAVDVGGPPLQFEDRGIGAGQGRGERGGLDPASAGEDAGEQSGPVRKVGAASGL